MSRLPEKTSLEVVAAFKGAVLDARHLRVGPAAASARTLAGVGALLLLVGLGLFGSQTLGQQAEWTAFQRLAAQAAMTGQALPSGPPSSWMGVALGLVLGGVASLAWASVRASDRDASSYTIGEGPHAALATPPVDLLTPDRFELVRLSAAGAAGLRFTAAMTGEITVGAQRYSLQEWVRRGWAVEDRGVFGTTLPAGARCRIEFGALVFRIAVVDRCAASVGRFEVDALFWAISGGSCLALGGLLALALMVAPGAREVGMDDRTGEARFVGYAQQPPVVQAPTRLDPAPAAHRTVKTAGAPQTRPAMPPAPSAPAPDAGSPRATTRTRISRRSEHASGDAGGGILGLPSVAIAGSLMTRGEDPIADAAKAGALGFVDTSVFENEYATAFSPGANDKAMWQAMKDSDPMAKPVGGLGLVGKGRGGGAQATDDMVRGGPKAVPEDADEPAMAIRVGRATVRGPRDRADVRSFVLKHLRFLRRCYDGASDRGPIPRGRVFLEFEIDASGVVMRASLGRARAVDTRVTLCMARAARAWSFPAQKGKRRSVVSIPVTLGPS